MTPSPDSKILEGATPLPDRAAEKRAAYAKWQEKTFGYKEPVEERIARDVHTIRNVAVFWVVLVIVGLVAWLLWKAIL